MRQKFKSEMNSTKRNTLMLFRERYELDGIKQIYN